MTSALIAVLALIVLLGVLIFVHELGHFLAAKAAGIYVHRFSLGIGPPIPALTTRRGETEYAISWLPIGGYVKMASREEDPASSALEGGPASAAVPPDRVYEAKPIWVRMIVILAGVTMNVLFAWLIFSGLAYARGVTIYPVTTIGSVQKQGLPPGAEEMARLELGDRIVRVSGRPVATWEDVEDAILSTSADSFAVELEGKPPVMVRIHRDALESRLRAARAIDPWIPPVADDVIVSGPAARAGVRKGDTLVALGGRDIIDWRQAVEIIEARPDQEIEVVVGRAAGRDTLTVHTLADSVADSLGKRKVGKIRLGVQHLEQHRPFGLGPALVEGGRRTLGSSTQIVRVVRGMLSGRVSTREVGGPIAIGAAAGQAAKLGVGVFVGYMGLISVNLAVINLLPIPVLDGGQFLFLLGEAVLRRPLNVKLRERLTMVGLVVIGLLMVLAFSNDIRRLLGLL
jgi:regulator of sigma E protease